MGVLMIDLPDLSLCDEDKKLLQNKAVAGVILFSRNYQDPCQLADLVSEIRASSAKRLLISVDHEGGRVQRFKQGFTLIPPAQAYAQLRDLTSARQLAFDAGWVLAMELMAFDIDLSFAPVLDLGHDCLAIGSRSFHQDFHIAKVIASAMIDGMHSAGMKTTGKHFPGHGGVIADSHQETPIDNRSRAAIKQDMRIFVDLIKANKLDAIMPAHVIYPEFDDNPASGSPFWLKTILREQLNFKGVIFSDDLFMAGADLLGSYAQRAKVALSAGCDILLACNHRQGTLSILDSLDKTVCDSSLYDKSRNDKANRLFCDQRFNDKKASYQALMNNYQWQERNKALNQLNDEWLTQHGK